MRLIKLAAVCVLAALIGIVCWARAAAQLTTMQAATHPVATEPTASNRERQILYWWDPMLGPSSISKKPGKSAMGMDLVPVYGTQAQTENGIQIDPAVEQNMGVRTAKVVRGPLTVNVRAMAVLKIPEPGIHEISLRKNGWIQKLYADTEGTHIRRGDVLFDFYSPDIVEAETELLMEINRGNSKQSDNLINPARQRLAFWGVADQDIDAVIKAGHALPTVPIRSPANGDVMEKVVVEGSYAQAGTTLMKIEDHARLWVDAQVYPDQLPLIRVGQPMDVTIDSLPSQQFTTRVSFIFPHLDELARTDIVRGVLESPLIKPGMYATVRIATQPLPNAILAPSEAVIDTGTRKIVFVALGNGHFESRDVRVGLAGDDNQMQILQGLAPGDQVVTSGQFLMDVESRTKEAIQKLTAR